MKTLSDDTVFWYIYLHSKDIDSYTGVIHIHVIYDVVNDSGVPKEITTGFFDQTVKLPFSVGSSVDNTLFCLLGVDYLTNTWLKEAAL